MTQRYHKELAIIENRLKLEKAILSTRYRFLEKKGIWRKRRPFSNDTLRSWRRISQYIAKKRTKQERKWKYTDEE